MSSTEVELSPFHAKARSAPALVEARNVDTDSSDMTTKAYSPDADKGNMEDAQRTDIGENDQ